MRVRMISACAAAVLALAGSGAWAVPAGPSGPSTMESVPAAEGGEAGCLIFGACSWEVGAPGDRISVVFDPASGPWIKDLGDPDGLAVFADDAPDGGVFLTQGFPLSEFLVVGDGEAWTDWHEEILTDGWTWQTATATATRPDGSTERVEATLTGAFGPDAPGTVADFVFGAPLPSGTTIDLVKRFAYTGFDGTFRLGFDVVGEDLFEGTIRIAERPTIDGIPIPRVPEPLTLALVALGLAALAPRRRAAR